MGTSRRVEVLRKLSSEKRTILSYGPRRERLRRLSLSVFTNSDVVQITTYYTNQDDRDAIGEVLNEQLNDVRPVNTGVCVELIDSCMKIEISAVAIKPT